MNNLAALPVVLPVVIALALVLWPKPTVFRRSLVGLVLAALLGFALWLVAEIAVAGPLVLRVGGWPVPYGIVLVADTLSAVMLALASFTALACAAYGFAETPMSEEHPLRLPLLLFLLAGIDLSFLTGDLFNLFVAFEVMLLSSYGLLTLESGARESRGALPYLTINLVGSALFLATCGFAYSLLGTLNFAEMIVRADALAGDPRLTLLGGLLMLVFGLKAGVFPLYYWLPTSYPILPAPVAAFYAGMLTKVGVYVLLRVFGTVFPASEHGLHTTLAWAAGFTMVVGVLGAVGQARVQVILSYHIVSQIGFMVLAIGLHSVAGFAAAIFYIIHHIVVKSALFLAGGCDHPGKRHGRSFSHWGALEDGAVAWPAVPVPGDVARGLAAAQRILGETHDHPGGLHAVAVDARRLLARGEHPDVGQHAENLARGLLAGHAIRPGVL